MGSPFHAMLHELPQITVTSAILMVPAYPIEKKIILKVVGLMRCNLFSLVLYVRNFFEFVEGTVINP